MHAGVARIDSHRVIAGVSFYRIENELQRVSGRKCAIRVAVDVGIFVSAGAVDLVDSSLVRQCEHRAAALERFRTSQHPSQLVITTRPSYGADVAGCGQCCARPVALRSTLLLRWCQK